MHSEDRKCPDQTIQLIRTCVLISQTANIKYTFHVFLQHPNERKLNPTASMQRKKVASQSGTLNIRFRESILFFASLKVSEESKDTNEHWQHNQDLSLMSYHKHALVHVHSIWTQQIPWKLFDHFAFCSMRDMHIPWACLCNVTNKNPIHFLQTCLRLHTDSSWVIGFITWLSVPKTYICCVNNEHTNCC